MKISHISALMVTLACAASPAAAQFTSAVVPPRAPRQVDTTAARADSVKRARIQLAERMSDMKAWVDSAAVALASRPAPTDTAAATANAAPAAAPRGNQSVNSEASGEVVQSRNSTARFRNGAPAPATTTQLPLLTLAGIGAILAGLALRRR